jgi:hypothetical protein
MLLSEPLHIVVLDIVLLVRKEIYSRTAKNALFSAQRSFEGLEHLLLHHQLCRE